MATVSLPPQKFAAVVKFELIYGTIITTKDVEQLPQARWLIRRSTWLHKFTVGGTDRHYARKSHWPINTWASHSQCLSGSLKRGTPTNMTHRPGYRCSTSHVPLQTDAHNLSLVTSDCGAQWNGMLQACTRAPDRWDYPRGRSLRWVAWTRHSRRTEERCHRAMNKHSGRTVCFEIKIPNSLLDVGCQWPQHFVNVITKAWTPSSASSHSPPMHHTFSTR